MSDAQKLKDSVVEYQNANKKLDDKLVKAVEDNRLRQQDKEGQSNRQS